MSNFIISNRLNRFCSSAIGQGYCSEIKRRNSRNGKPNFRQNKTKSGININKIHSNDRSDVEKISIASKTMEITKLATSNLSLSITNQLN